MLTALKGSVVRIAPNELAFSGAKAWDDIYGNKVGWSNQVQCTIKSLMAATLDIAR
jgi:hypothetical protein